MVCQRYSARSVDVRRPNVALVAAAVSSVVGLQPRDAFAHGGIAHADGAWWLHWNWDPVILSSLALLAGLYLFGVRRLWRLGGAGRGISRRQAIAFALGILTLFAALVSPIDLMSDELSSVHMVQHMLLMMVAAPLVVLGNAAYALLWATPDRCSTIVREGLRRIAAWRAPRYLLWQPLLMWSLYAVTLWIWHLPALYQAALRDQLVHDLQHLAFFVSACLFWRVLLDPLSRWRLSRGLGVLYLFTTSLHASVLGVYMALSPRVWYGDYIGRTEVWGLKPLEDQQLAGVIMWMPACTLYAIAATALFVLWLEEFEPAARPSQPGRRGAVDKAAASPN